MARSHLDQPAADGMAIMIERVAERSRRDGSGHLVVAGQQVADEEC
jgi:limonene-1,2-epoxide hydrolase